MPDGYTYVDYAISADSFSCGIDFTGTGSIQSDPQFVSVNDLRPSKYSPCLGRGTNGAWTAGATDIGGNPRVNSVAVDMGAYEFTFSVLRIGDTSGKWGGTGPAVTRGNVR
jgi:hypothetical protein